MLRKLIMAMLCLSVVCMPLVVQAKEYAKDHPFFSYEFWQKATKEDVEKAIKKDYDINTKYHWGSEEADGDAPPAYDEENILAFALGMNAGPDAIEALIKNGAIIDGGVMRNAKSLEALKKLIEFGGNINALNWNNETVLHDIPFLAPDMVKFLLENGAIANIKSILGATPMSAMVDNSDPDSEDWKTNMALLEKAGATLDNGKYPKELGLPKYTVEKNALKKYSKDHNFYNEDFWRVATLKDVQQSFIPGEALAIANKPKDEDSILAYASDYSSDPEIIEFLFKNGAVIDEGSIFSGARNPNAKILTVLLQHMGNTEKDLNDAELAAIYAYEAGLEDNLLAIFKKWPKIGESGPSDWQFYYEEPTEGRPDREKALKLFKGYKP